MRNMFIVELAVMKSARVTMSVMPVVVHVREASMHTAGWVVGVIVIMVYPTTMKEVVSWSSVVRMTRVMRMDRCMVPTMNLVMHNLNNIMVVMYVPMRMIMRIVKVR